MTPRSNSSPLLFVALAASVALLGGCASPADREAMAVGAGVPIVKKHPNSVSVRASGGSETGAMDSSNVSDADLKAAIEESIGKTGVFSRVLQGRDADYELTVTIVQLDKPVIGLSFVVNLETSWVLQKISDKSFAMRKVVKSSHTATFSDAFAAVTRLRLAVEGAVRANIEQGIGELSRLSL